jgi:hypothetical protein
MIKYKENHRNVTATLLPKNTEYKFYCPKNANNLLVYWKWEDGDL